MPAEWTLWGSTSVNPAVSAGVRSRGAGEEGCHLGSCDGPVGAESQGFGGAADCDVGGCEGVDAGGVDAAGVDVGESGGVGGV